MCLKSGLKNEQYRNRRHRISALLLVPVTKHCYANSYDTFTRNGSREGNDTATGSLVKLMAHDLSSLFSSWHENLFSCWHENTRISFSRATLKLILGYSRTLYFALL
jgi:hypothetical protein